MQQTVATRQNLDDRAELEQLEHRTFVNLADLDLSSQAFDAFLSPLGRLGIDGGDGDVAVVLDVDGRAGLLGNRSDGRTTLADHIADALGVDLHGVHARREVGQFGASTFHRGAHLLEDMQPAFTRLCECDLHDLFRDALDLDVHLQRSDAAVGTGHLEVHVAEVIFVAQDVGEHRKAVAFLDQTHGDTGDMLVDRHTGIHHRQAAAANRRHRGRAIGLGNLGDHPHRIGKLLDRRHQCGQSAFGKTAMTDFATLGRTESAGLTGGKGRHVVLEHEAIAVFTVNRVDDLLVACGAKGRHHQRLGLASGKQRRAMRTRKHAGANRDRANGAGIAAIDASFTRQDLAAHNARLQLEEDVAQLVGIGRRLAGSGCLGDHGCLGRLLDGPDELGALLLVAGAIGIAHAGLGQRRDAGNQGLIAGRRLPFPLGFAGDLDQLVDRLDDRLHLVMAIDHRPQHDVFRQLVGFGLDHHDGRIGAGNHQIELAGLELRGGRIEQVLAVDVTDASGADRAIERQT